MPKIIANLAKKAQLFKPVGCQTSEWKYLPVGPTRKTINRMPKSNPGIAYAAIMIPEVQTSNADPSLTALRIPRGIDTK